MLAGPATGRLSEAKTLRLELQGCPGALFGEMGISNREEGSAQALRCDGQRELLGTGLLGPTHLKKDDGRVTGRGDQLSGPSRPGL